MFVIGLVVFFVLLQLRVWQARVLPVRPKFFVEKRNNPHIDMYYSSDKTTTPDEIQSELRFLMSEFTTQCSACKPVIMYGTLIGWYVNKRMLPWDNDIDVVVLEDYVETFVRTFDGMQTDHWIIQVNPNYKNKDTRDKNNKIDARMISKRNGVFIDVTFLWRDSRNDQFLFAKDGNRYKVSDILPLRETKFEDNEPVYVPNRVKSVLIQKYPKVDTETWNIAKKNGWVFVNNEWQKM